MNIEQLELQDGYRTEPLHLDNTTQIWVVFTIGAGLVRRIRLSGEKPRGKHSRPLIAKLLRQILLGRDGTREELKFEISGTPFQQAVWQETCKIPSGCLKYYQDIAQRIGCKSARAVGQALKKNPLPIIIPCHRVIGKDGKLTGFSCGLEIKKKLIDFESNIKECQP